MYRITKSSYYLMGALFYLSILCSSCDGNSYKNTFPPVLLSFATVQADIEGKVAFLVTDDYEMYSVLQDKTNTVLEAKETKRVVCYYEITESKEAVILYSLGYPIATEPLLPSMFPELKQDPVSLQSGWVGNDYLNLLLQIRLAEASKHKLAFIEESVVYLEGVKTIFLSLYHDASDDHFSYTDRVYCSIPLHKYIVNEDLVQVVFSYFDYAGNRQSLVYKIGNK